MHFSAVSFFRNDGCIFVWLLNVLEMISELQFTYTSTILPVSATS